ncbi:hypothetical protein [Aquimarina sp. AU58]|uniref:hypothetical protein n=1 Tax=Aquimarina sp. AU58 TaxID=1874112 RepID=UPI00135A8B38|nr:hypothetical protein [Aquimarina sp. AU58]
MILESGLTSLVNLSLFLLHLTQQKMEIMQADSQYDKNKFMSDILQALHLKMDTFMYNLVHYTPYEIILYSWINACYTKGKTSDETIQLIYKARNILLLNLKNGLCNPPKPIDTSS